MQKDMGAEVPGAIVQLFVPLLVIVILFSPCRSGHGHYFFELEMGVRAFLFSGSNSSMFRPKCNLIVLLCKGPVNLHFLQGRK